MQAVCFDFDGTLVDSEIFHAQNWSQYLSGLNIDISAHDFLADFAGVPWEKVANHFSSMAPIPHSTSTVVSDMERLTYQAIVERGIPAKQGAFDLIKSLHGSLPLAVVTGSPRVYVEGILSHLGWLHYFDHVFCGEDVANNKPAPEIYQLACRTLGVREHQAVAIEDSQTGAQSAFTAGLRLVVVNDLHPFGAEMTPYRYDNLAEAQAQQAKWLVA
ncbi:HAD family phosphatase [Photobacterium rosenbergii]|uniref:HAD family phosphatase n=1 Tax=Photobacterium rosenbergii TaxID=294936 RepID=A0A2T3N739_9GAMM|nr:HAD family phosphatase [Photobacterium rosenbergii]PSW08696.1 HAD family phosphatase [Photobacterium rosenbergii]